MSIAVQQIVMDALRAALRDRLAQCTGKQQAFFGRIYPKGIDEMSEDELRNGVDLCDRTIRKNQSDPSRLVDAEVPELTDHRRESKP